MRYRAHGRYPLHLVASWHDKLALSSTRCLGTIWCFYAFALFGLVPLIDPEHQATYLYWSNVVQLVALPLIAVGTNVLSRSTRQRDQETHEAVLAELAIIRQEYATVRAIAKALELTVPEQQPVTCSCDTKPRKISARKVIQADPEVMTKPLGKADRDIRRPRKG